MALDVNELSTTDATAQAELLRRQELTPLGENSRSADGRISPVPCPHAEQKSYANLTPVGRSETRDKYKS